MTFLDLITLLKSDDDALARVLADQRYSAYAASYAGLVRDAPEQEAVSASSPLPEELCRWAVALLKARYCLHGQWLRKDLEAGAAGEGSLTALAVFDRYGGEPLVWVEELGAFDVTKKDRPA
jgi:hypothetical protein